MAGPESNSLSDADAAAIASAFNSAQSYPANTRPTAGGWVTYNREVTQYQPIVQSGNGTNTGMPYNQYMQSTYNPAQVRHYTEIWGITFVYEFTPNYNAVPSMNNESDAGRLKRMLDALANDVNANQIRNDRRNDDHEARLNAQSERVDGHSRRIDEWMLRFLDEGVRTEHLFDELRNKVALLEATNNDLLEANGMLTEAIANLRGEHFDILQRVATGETIVDDNLRKMGVDLRAMNETLKVEAEASQRTRAVVEATTKNLSDVNLNFERRMAGFASKLEAITKSIKFKPKKNPDVAT